MGILNFILQSKLMDKRMKHFKERQAIKKGAKNETIDNNTKL